MILVNLSRDITDFHKDFSDSLWVILILTKIYNSWIQYILGKLVAVTKRKIKTTLKLQITKREA